MQNQVRPQLSLVGLQRTGTNYVEHVLRATLQDVQISFSQIWKHAFRNETDVSKIGGKIVIVARHPVLWLQSCLLNSAKDIKESRSDFFVDGVDPVVGFANVYNRFYGGWLEHKAAVGGYVVRYEGVVENGSDSLAELFSGYYKVDELSGDLRTAPMSVQLSAEDLKAVVNRECALPFEVANLFWAHIDPAISAGLAYTFEEINFSGSFSEGQRLRAAAYKVTEKPQTLTDEDFELLLRVGKDTFQNDGLVLGQIGTKLFKDGDVEGAFDWLMQAVQTIRRNDNKIFRVQLDSPLADYLELLSKACLISRERTVEQLKQHYDRVKPKTGHSLAGKEWNLKSMLEQARQARPRDRTCQSSNRNRRNGSHAEGRIRMVELIMSAICSPAPENNRRRLRNFARPRRGSLWISGIIGPWRRNIAAFGIAIGCSNRSARPCD